MSPINQLLLDLNLEHYDDGFALLVLRWDDKQVSTLKAKKEKLSEELRQAMKNSRKESEIQTIQSQISGLRTRLKYSTNDRDSTKKKIEKLDRDLEKMKEDLETHGPKIRNIESVMRERESQIEDTKEKMNTVEDRIFKKFCESIGVTNIRFVFICSLSTIFFTLRLLNVCVQ